MTPLLEANGLIKDFGPIRAVDGITFTVSPGEAMGFLGRNGAGKSTSMKMLTGFLRPTAGTYCVGETLDLRANVFDRNEPGLTVPDGSVAWRVGLSAPFATGKATSRAFDSAGNIQLIARATDSGGLFSEDSVGLTITDCSDQPPVVTVTSPLDQETFFYTGFDEALNMWYPDDHFTGTALDPEDGTLSGAALVWTTDQTALQAPLLGTGSAITGRLYSNVCSGVTHNVTLEATDSFGNVRSALVRVGIYTIC